MSSGHGEHQPTVQVGQTAQSMNHALELGQLPLGQLTSALPIAVNKK